MQYTIGAKQKHEFVHVYINSGKRILVVTYIFSQIFLGFIILLVLVQQTTKFNIKSMVTATSEQRYSLLISMQHSLMFCMTFDISRNSYSRANKKLACVG